MNLQNLLRTAIGRTPAGMGSHRRTWRWTGLGVAFVLASWGLSAIGDAWPGSLGALHRQNPAYFLIDIAPLGLFLMARWGARPTSEPAPSVAAAVLPPALPWVETAPECRVLIADDNAVNRRVAALMLQRAGHKVVEAADGREAVQRVQEGGFDLVLMDVQMPLMDGLEATRSIRRRDDGPARLPIVAMTGQASAGDIEACVEAGMDGYVSKPLKAITLLAAVESWVGRRDASSSGVANATDCPIDEAALDELRSYASDPSEDILVELTATFLEGAVRHLAVMRDALAGHDVATFERAAHTLKGSAATLGARRLADVCRRLESEARQGRLPGGPDALDRVQEEIETVREYMDRAIGATL